MDLETSQLLRRLTELTEENNKILLSVQKHTRWATFFTVVKWTLFITLTVGSYFAVQPYIGDIVNGYKNLESTKTQSEGLQNYLKNIQNQVKYVPSTVGN